MDVFLCNLGIVLSFLGTLLYLWYLLIADTADTADSKGDLWYSVSLILVFLHLGWI